MQILEQLGLVLGLASLAGVNLYLTVLVTGLALRFDWLHLAAQHQNLEVLGHPVVLLVAGVLFCMEFFADKIPWVDSLWDSVHTIIRPVGGVLLGLQVAGEMPLYAQVTAALLAGGAALTTHGAKAGTRLLVNHSPEPASNVTLSVTEDVAVTGGVALTLLHPLAALMVFGGILVVLWLLFPKLWRASKATVWLVWKKLRMPGLLMPPPVDPVTLERRMNDSLRDLLLLQGGLDEAEVTATVRCLSGKSKGVKGLTANLHGVLLLTPRRDHVYFAASKGLSDRVFRVPMEGAEVFVESRFLSENVVVESPLHRMVLRFPRGEGALAATVASRLQPEVAAPVVPAQGHDEPTEEVTEAKTEEQSQEEPGPVEPPVEPVLPSPMVTPRPAVASMVVLKQLASPVAPSPAPERETVDSEEPHEVEAQEEPVKKENLVPPFPSLGQA